MKLSVKGIWQSLEHLRAFLAQISADCQSLSLHNYLHFIYLQRPLRKFCVIKLIICFFLCAVCSTRKNETVTTYKTSSVTSCGADVYCRLCSVAFNSDKQAVQHYTGKSHTRRLRYGNGLPPFGSRWILFCLDEFQFRRTCLYPLYPLSRACQPFGLFCLSPVSNHLSPESSGSHTIHLNAKTVNWFFEINKREAEIRQQRLDL